jgi:hypothetical protein
VSRASGGEEPVEIEVAGRSGHRHRARIDDGELAAGDETIELPVENGRVLDQHLGRLLTGDQDPGLAEFERSMPQKLHGENGLSRPRISRDQGRPAGWQAAAAEVVEARNPGR